MDNERIRLEIQTTRPSRALIFPPPTLRGSTATRGRHQDPTVFATAAYICFKACRSCPSGLDGFERMSTWLPMARKPGELACARSSIPRGPCAHRPRSQPTAVSRHRPGEPSRRAPPRERGHPASKTSTSTLTNSRSTTRTTTRTPHVRRVQVRKSRSKSTTLARYGVLRARILRVSERHRIEERRRLRGIRRDDRARCCGRNPALHPTTQHDPARRHPDRPSEGAARASIGVGEVGDGIPRRRGIERYRDSRRFAPITADARAPFERAAGDINGDINRLTLVPLDGERASVTFSGFVSTNATPTEPRTRQAHPAHPRLLNSLLAPSRNRPSSSRVPLAVFGIEQGHQELSADSINLSIGRDFAGARNIVRRTQVWHVRGALRVSDGGGGSCEFMYS